MVFVCSRRFIMFAVASLVLKRWKSFAMRTSSYFSCSLRYSSIPPLKSRSELSIEFGPFCRTFMCSPGVFPTEPTRFYARPPFMSLIGGRAGTAEEFLSGARSSFFIFMLE